MKKQAQIKNTQKSSLNCYLLLATTPTYFSVSFASKTQIIVYTDH